MHMDLSTVELFKNLKPVSDGYVLLEGDTLKKYQRTILKMAEDIIKVCEDNGIYYQLSGGTALGAIRHGGFIPWDDDMDINILSSQLDCFKEKIIQTYGDKYCVQTYRDKEYGIVMSRIRLKNSISRTREDVYSEECGFPIDIFAIENVFNNPLLRIIQGFFCMGFGLLLSCRNFYKNRKFLRELEKSNPETKKVFEIKIAIGFLTAFLSVKRWAIITNWCYGLCKDEQSKYVNIPGGRKHYFGEMYKRDGMLDTVAVPFEGHQWMVAKDYDAYFKALYGNDYMTPPPPEKRETHILLELKFPEEMDER